MTVVHENNEPLVTDEEIQCEIDEYENEPWESLYAWYGANVWVCRVCGDDFIDPPSPSDFDDFEEYHKYARDYDPWQDQPSEFTVRFDGMTHVRPYACNGCIETHGIEAVLELCDYCGWFPVDPGPEETLPPCDTCDDDPRLYHAKQRLAALIDAPSRPDPEFEEHVTSAALAFGLTEDQARAVYDVLVAQTGGRGIAESVTSRLVEACAVLIHAGFVPDRVHELIDVSVSNDSIVQGAWRAIPLGYDRTIRVRMFGANEVE